MLQHSHGVQAEFVRVVSWLSLYFGIVHAICSANCRRSALWRGTPSRTFQLPGTRTLRCELGPSCLVPEDWLPQRVVLCRAVFFCHVAFRLLIRSGCACIRCTASHHTEATGTQMHHGTRRRCRCSRTTPAAGTSSSWCGTTCGSCAAGSRVASALRLRCRWPYWSLHGKVQIQKISIVASNPICPYIGPSMSA